MKFELRQTSASLISRQEAQEILLCNDFTEPYGLMLSPQQAAELARTRTQSLRASGRIEFGGGAVKAIIRVFCNSPYINKFNYAATINQLVEIFYCYKTETLDKLGDDELIERMAAYFNGISGGSTELLAERDLARAARNLRCGRAPDDDGGEECSL